MEDHVVEVVPNAKRLVSGYRDVGYTFNGAMADLVDNSIAAGATEVRVDMVWDGVDSQVLIADNGSGMSRHELEEALRLGSDADYEEHDLGKFGLGLKTASISQCRVLQVASRREADDVASVLRFDLDHIERTNRWEVLRENPSSLPVVAQRWLEGRPGTVVVWSDMDRLLNGYMAIDRAEKTFFENVAGLELHLSMVFHRFLAQDARIRRHHPEGLAIYVNGKRLSPWDPFASSHARTHKLPSWEVPLASRQWSGLVEFHPYVLPARDQFDSTEEHERLAGPNKWNNQQGFYIYRANRLIQSGGWSGLIAPNEHYKLARIAVDFTPSLDNAFGINIAKMRVTLPSQLKDAVRADVRNVIKTAETAYNPKKREKNPLLPASTTVEGVSHPARPGWAAVASASGSVQDKPDKPVPSSDISPEPLAPWPEASLRDVERQRRRAALENAADKTNNATALKDIIALLARTDRKTADDLGW